MDAGAQAVVMDRFVKSTGKLKPRVGAGIFGQDMIHRALQQRPDRAVGNRRVRLFAPVCLDPAFIGGVKLPVRPQNAHIQMIMRQNLRDFCRHRLNGRAEIQLPRQQPRDAEQMVQQSCRGRFNHFAILRQGDHCHPASMAEKPRQTYSIPRIRLAGTRRVLGKSRKRAA
ncbi:MAG: hypothetical protein ACD_54C01311G0002 [uncultured bacterium]|nr:MAG: hypothetical protein ACD_54C01311G0002 [uncultured bacterium]